MCYLSLKNICYRYLIGKRVCYLCSRDCLASRGVTVSFRVWLSGRDDFRREWYNGTVVWVKIIYLFVIRGCYLLFTM